MLNRWCLRPGELCVHPGLSFAIAETGAEISVAAGTFTSATRHIRLRSVLYTIHEHAYVTRGAAKRSCSIVSIRARCSALDCVIEVDALTWTHLGTNVLRDFVIPSYMSQNSSEIYSAAPNMVITRLHPFRNGELLLPCHSKALNPLHVECCCSGSRSCMPVVQTLTEAHHGRSESHVYISI